MRRLHREDEHQSGYEQRRVLRSAHPVIPYHQMGHEIWMGLGRGDSGIPNVRSEKLRPTVFGLPV